MWAVVDDDDDSDPSVEVSVRAGRKYKQGWLPLSCFSQAPPAPSLLLTALRLKGLLSTCQASQPAGLSVSGHFPIHLSVQAEIRSLCSCLKNFHKGPSRINAFLNG